MKQGNLRALLLLIAVTITSVALIAGCGGGGSSSSSSASSGSAGGKSTSGSGSKSGGSGSSSSGAATEPSAEFVDPRNKGVAQFVGFGKEAPASEREAASKVLTENLEARASGDFVRQCTTLDANTLSSLSASGKKGKAAIEACTTALTALAVPLQNTKKARADLLTGPISAFRVKGNRGYALFHGTDKNNYAMLMTKEDGRWKVGSILNVDLGCPPGALGCVASTAPSAPSAG